MFDAKAKVDKEKVEALELAMEKLEYAFKVMRENGLEFRDSISNRRVFELRESIVMLRKIIGPKKDSVVGVMVVELIRALYNSVSKEEFMNLILNNEETYLKYEKMIEK